MAIKYIMEMRIMSSVIVIIVFRGIIALTTILLNTLRSQNKLKSAITVTRIGWLIFEQRHIYGIKLRFKLLKTQEELILSVYTDEHIYGIKLRYKLMKKN